MRIATWNVNSITARLPRVLAWIEKRKPDVLCLQELKTPDAAFPFQHFEALGYHAVVHGQKQYNGVAILSLSTPVGPRKGMCDGRDDPEARLVAATCSGVRVVSVYVPNGGDMGSPSYASKLDWLSRFKSYTERELAPDEPVVVCGDFNIAASEKDCHDPDFWEGTVVYNEELRSWLRDFLDQGFVDTFRIHHPEEKQFSWWDYRGGAFFKNEGLRIDFILASRALAERCVAAGIDGQERKGQKPSDHAPVWADFDI